MEILNGIDQDDVGGGGGDCTDIDGATIDDSIIGGTTPAEGSFTVLKASTDPADADGVGDQGFNDGRYCLESNNLSDVGDAATSFGNIKQAATDSVTGVSELATDAETVTGTATDRVSTPANITAKMAAPGAIGGTTPSSGAFTTLDDTGQIQGVLLNNQMVQKATFDILGLMVDPRFLNLQCEDPGAGTMIDVSGQGHDGTYQGSMTTGDRIKKGMGWALDLDGISDCVDLGDSDDFSFGDGSNDEDVTWFGVFEFMHHSATQGIISKADWEQGLNKREWYLRMSINDTFEVYLIDESTDVYTYRIQDSALSFGWHSYTVTYDGAGGANAADTIKIYIDGVLVPSTATNNASYTAMENLSTPVLIGSFENSSTGRYNFFIGDIAMSGLDGSVWSAKSIWMFHQLCKGLYGI